ncbi:MAG: N-acetylneuraminate synthase family protein [Promethearchaeota archaeon]
MVKPIKIKNKIIGKGHPTFLVAEMACAHQGNVEYALDLVKVAIEAKADAIQLQVFKKELYMSPIYKGWDLATKLELNQSEWSKIIEFIKGDDILLFAAGYDIESIKFLIEKEVDAFKIHSADISNPEVLKEVAKSKKLIFLSCGASSIEEIKKAIEFLRGNGTEDIVLMHGYQGFPTKIEDLNLNYIKTLESTFDLNVGFYDHVDGSSELAINIPIMSIGYGSQVIEKHFILNREDKGIDYESSLNPDKFIHFVKLLRESEKAIGDKIKRDFTEGELSYRTYCKKSIVAKIPIPKGSKITREKVEFLRSNPGISPDEFDKIVGKIVKADIKQYHNLTYEDIE